MDQSRLVNTSQNDDALEDCSQKWHEAAFILAIKEKYGVSQVAIDHALSSVNELASAVVKIVLAKLKRKLPAQSVELVTQLFNEAFPLFTDLSTSYLQMKIFREIFNVIVSAL